MLKIYCSKCGGLNTYVSEKPNFCQKCGSPMNASTARAQTRPKQELQIEEDEDEEHQAQGNFNLDGLDFEYEVGTSTEKLGSIAGSLSEEDLKNLNSEKITLPKNKKRYTEEDFRAEAGNLRDGGGNEAGST